MNGGAPKEDDPGLLTDLKAGKNKVRIIILVFSLRGRRLEGEDIGFLIDDDDDDVRSGRENKLRGV